MMPARPPLLTAEARLAPGRIVITVRGELDVTTVPVLSACLAEVAAESPARLVLDLAALTFADCAGARVIACAGSILSPGSAVVLRSPAPSVRRVLELTGLAERCLIDQAHDAKSGGQYAVLPLTNDLIDWRADPIVLRLYRTASASTVCRPYRRRCARSP